MKKRLELLEQLQEIDLLVDVMKSSQNSLQDEMNDIAKSLDDAREGLAALNTRVAELVKEKETLEACNVTEQENIKRSETNMKEIKTNKEYQAVGREIAAARKQVAELEEQILQKITLIDELNGEIATAAASLEEQEQNCEQRRSEKQVEIDKVQQDIDTDDAKREAIRKELPSNLLKRYDTLRQQRRGQALAIAREGFCQGCNMHLPPQLYNSLFKADDILTCPHCQRVLILKLQAA